MNWKKSAEGCSAHSRCKNIRNCPLCRNQWAKKNMEQRFKNVDDKIINSFKYVQFIGVTVNSLSLSEIEHFELIDDYLKRLTNFGNRRAKKHPLHEAEYLIFRELTKSSSTKQFLPHLHMIVLRNHEKPFDFNEEMKLQFNIQNIEPSDWMDLRNDPDNLMLQSLKNIYIYCTKFDKAAIAFEEETNLLKNKSNVLFSKLFSKSPKPHLEL